MKKFQFLRTAVLSLALVFNVEASNTGRVAPVAGGAMLACSLAMAMAGVAQVTTASDPVGVRVALLGAASLSAALVLGMAGYSLMGDREPPLYPSNLMIYGLPANARVQVDGEPVEVHDGVATHSFLLEPNQDLITVILITVGERELSLNLEMFGGQPRQISYASLAKISRTAPPTPDTAL